MTIALFVLGITLPSTPWIDENRAIYISIVALVALAIGGALWFLGINLAKQEHQCELTILDILEQMDSLLREEAIRESQKPFNQAKYSNNKWKLNAEIFGIKYMDIITPEAAEKELKRTIPILVRRSKNQSKAERFKDAEMMSGVLDVEGFGLKRFRAKGKYKQLMNLLTVKRNDITDSKLNTLIKEHINESETMNNLLLDKERAFRVQANYEDTEYKINNFLNSQLLAAVNKLEQESRERIIKKRETIGTRIKELEAENDSLS